MRMSAMRKTSELIFNSSGIVHLREQTHISRNTARGILSRAVERGELVQLFRGTYADARIWPSNSDFPRGILAIKAELIRARIQCIAISQAHPDRVLTGIAAALIHSLPLLDIPQTLTLSSSVKSGSSTLKTHHGLQFHQNYLALPQVPRPPSMACGSLLWREPWLISLLLSRASTMPRAANPRSFDALPKLSRLPTAPCVARSEHLVRRECSLSKPCRGRRRHCALSHQIGTLNRSFRSSQRRGTWPFPVLISYPTCTTNGVECVGPACWRC